jgi:hypothetical protein
MTMRITKRGRALSVVLSAALVPGCASTLRLNDVPVGGRQVTVVPAERGVRVQGELLVADKERLWLRTKDGVREFPLGDVREVQVRRHGFGARQAFAWAGAGAAVSGIGLAAACGSVEGSGNCGGVGLIAAGIWLLAGALTAPAFESSSKLKYPAPSADTLRPYARLPQGLPPGVTPSTLAAPPAAPKMPPEPNR